MIKFNPKTHVLGSLCKRGHEYRKTGKSLRYSCCVSSCVECAEEGHKRRYGENPEKVKESRRKASKKYRENNLEKHKEMCRKASRKWRKENPEKFKEAQKKSGQKFRKEHPERHREFGRNYTRKIRIAALMHYGGSPPKCACCRESYIEFLCIDHINGGGGKHRKALMKGKKGVVNFYQWLKKNKYPKGYRVLCHNCNCALGFYGYCPHKNKKESI